MAPVTWLACWLDPSDIFTTDKSREVMKNYLTNGSWIRHPFTAINTCSKDSFTFRVKTDYTELDLRIWIHLIEKIYPLPKRKDDPMVGSFSEWKKQKFEYAKEIHARLKNSISQRG